MLHLRIMEPTINPSQIQHLGIAVLITYTIIFLFCRSLVKTLSYVDEENRAISPFIIWLLLVPVLNYLVNFLVVFGLSKSISRELESRDFEEERRPTFLPGILFASLSFVIAVVVLLSSYGINLPTAVFPAFAIVAFSQIFFFVQYWMKVIWYKNILKNDEEETSQEENEA
jgi:hypothetical protein